MCCLDVVVVDKDGFIEGVCKGEVVVEIDEDEFFFIDFNVFDYCVFGDVELILMKCVVICMFVCEEVFVDWYCLL